ncbi:transcription initiation factor IIB [Halostella litorea]|uniref:transcription initiation factor IIB n=1 Tax=Halostella litorea TaxID=2528831 RepID=UPI001092E1A1|nr:transcription initiation factor IIB family protein [Halostella litorea]
MSLRDTYDSGFDEDLPLETTSSENPGTACPDCDGTLRTADGETACTECGLITDEYRLDHAATPRDRNDTETREQTGAPLTPARHDRGLVTSIGYRRDGNGNKLSQRKRRTLNRLRIQQRRGQFDGTADRNLAHACGEIARLTSSLDLSFACREEASRVFREAQSESLLVGRSVESMAAASVYAACRCRETLLTVGELAAVSSCEERDIWRAYGVLNTELGLDVPVRRPQAFVASCASACRELVPARVRRRALELATRSEKHGLANGRNPAGVAAGCLYYAGVEQDVSLTQAALAEAGNVSENTLRKRSAELDGILG